MSIQVSICCITYNHEKYIDTAIQGFLAQKTDFDIEIVIADDASTDGTAKIVEQYARAHPAIIRFVRHEQNIGMMNNFKFALQACKGKYVAICEGDDYWTDSYKLQRQVDLLESDTGAVICFHQVEIVNEIGERILVSNEMEEGTEFSTTDLIQREWFVMTCSILFRRECLAFPPWFTKIVNGDYAVQLLCSLEGKILYLNKLMAAYRRHSMGFSQTKITDEKNCRTLSVLYDHFNQFSNHKFQKIIKKRKDNMRDKLAEYYIHQTLKYGYLSKAYLKNYKKFIGYARVENRYHLKSSLQLLIPAKLYQLYKNL